MVGNYDFYKAGLANTSESLKERVGVSFDECSLLCLNDQLIQCASLSYNSLFRTCRWSTVDANTINDKIFNLFAEDTVLYKSNCLEMLVNIIQFNL